MKHHPWPSIVLVTLTGVSLALLPAGPEQVVRLNGPLGVGGDVADEFAFTPDGSHVVYRALQDDQPFPGIFSVPAAGGTPIRLSATVPVADPRLTPFEVSASRVVFSDGTALYSAPVDGSQAPVLLVHTAEHYLLSPDGARVAFVAPLDSPPTLELYSIPVDGSAAPTKLNPVLVSGGNVVSEVPDDLAFTPDGSSVLYRADQDTDELFELFVVPADGSLAARKLNGPLVAGGGVNFAGFQVSPDGARVVYIAVQDALDTQDLYSVPIDTSQAAVRLNAPLPSGGRVFPARITPDGTHVVYRADQDVDNIAELFVVPSDGSTASIKLSHAFPNPDFDVRADFQISGDSSHAVYTVREAGQIAIGLYTTPLDGSAPAAQIGLDVRQFEISPDASWVVFFGFGPGPFGAFRASLDAASILPMAGGLPFEITSDSSRVVYKTGLLPAREIYVTPLVGEAEPTLLSGPLAPIGPQEEDRSLRIGPDLRRVVYRDGNETVGFELFSTALAPEACAVSPSRGPSTGGNTVTLTGVGFTRGTRVEFGGVAAASVTWIHNTELRVVVPPHGARAATQGPATGRPGRATLDGLTVDVTVSEGSTSSTLADAYAYLPTVVRRLP